jgi:hypothetical protein
MKVEALTQVDREQARELWQKYQTHRAYQSPHDAEIAAIYKRIAQGKTVIRALESIRAAGMNEKGLPKLAIARADTALCYFHTRGRDEVQFSNDRWWNHRPRVALKSKTIPMAWPGVTSPPGTHEAQVPLVPVHMRPKRGLANYHILWEAEWTKRYPVDPYLLRRFGGDAWLVVAAWDLTDVERAVMGSRLRS